VRVAFLTDGAPPVEIRKAGVWGWFRLLADGGAGPTGGADRLSLALQSADRHAVLEVRAGIDHPFDLGRLGGFRCPERL
jgi:type VI protein secretion system component VasK